MSYDSTITFTLDTICPWTYLGYVRLRKALSAHRAAHPSSPVSFTLRIAPYQLYPEFSRAGVDRHVWYRDEKYGGSEARFDKYAAYMGALGKDEGIEFDFSSGPFANTFHAHRVLRYVQEHRSADAAVAALESLYQQYFTARAHPSSPETLVKACMAAGLDEDEAKRVVEDESEEAMETKMAIREQAGNGVDSVPYIVFEGKRRDFTLIGAKEVGEYIKTLEQVVKEAS
ncbi:thioredoxin-like protein [Didymella exigua CBS 183.55]|uniref:Thioredoxin-like protein n=1 Tax=Didymella exigua CBS 183.55 TaxID=1150837 RepID=A0A6A5RJS7_9PLEO|nr:thioredoxin-like protein [Didymella exigua CBS 183.55]KAF1927520.1 thioredoxin-like protein [Didymella exigua CBS 183.55]